MEKCIYISTTGTISSALLIILFGQCLQCEVSDFPLGEETRDVNLQL